MSSESSSSEFEHVELQKEVDLAHTPESRKSTRGSSKTLPFIQSPRLADLGGRSAFYTIFKDDMNLLKENSKSPEIPTQSDTTVPKGKTIGKEKGEDQENVEEVGESIHREECASSIKKNSANSYKTKGFKTVLPSVKAKNDETFPKISFPFRRCCDRNVDGKPFQQQVLYNKIPNTEDTANTSKPPNVNYFTPIAGSKKIPETDELSFENLTARIESDTFSQTSDPRSIFAMSDSDDRNSPKYDAGEDSSFLDANAAPNSTLRQKLDKNRCLVHPGCVTPISPLHQNIVYIRYPPGIVPVLDANGLNTMPIFTVSRSNMAPEDISKPQKFGYTISPFQYSAYHPQNYSRVPSSLTHKNSSTRLSGLQTPYDCHEQWHYSKCKSTADEPNDVLTGQSPELNEGVQRVNNSDAVKKGPPQRKLFVNNETGEFVTSGSKSDVTSVDKNSSAEIKFTACESQKNIYVHSQRKVTSPLSLAESLVAEDSHLQKDPCTTKATDYSLSDLSEEVFDLVTSKNYSTDCPPKIKPQSSCESQNVIYFPKVFKRDSFETLPKPLAKKIDLNPAAGINKTEDDVHLANTLKLSDDKVITSAIKKILGSKFPKNIEDLDRNSAFRVYKKNGASSDCHSSKADDPQYGSQFSKGSGREIKFFNDRCCSPIQPQDQKSKIAPLMANSIRLEEEVPDDKVASNLQKISTAEKDNPDEGCESIQLKNEMSSSKNTNTHFRNSQTETHVLPKITVKITSKNLCVDIYRLDISQSQDMQELEILISDAAASEREPGTFVHFPNTDSGRTQHDSPGFNSRGDDGQRSSTYKPDGTKPKVHSSNAKRGKAFDNYEFYNFSSSKRVRREANDNPTEVRDRSEEVSICSCKMENGEVRQDNKFKSENLEPQPLLEKEDLFRDSGNQDSESTIACPIDMKTITDIHTENTHFFALKDYAKDKEMERKREWDTLPRNETICGLPRPMRPQYSETKQKFFLSDEDPLHSRNLNSESATVGELKRRWLFPEKCNCDSQILTDLKTERKMDKNFVRHFIPKSSGPREPAYRKFTDHREYNSYVPTDRSVLLPSGNHMERGIPRNPIKDGRKNKCGRSFYDNPDSGYGNAKREMYGNEKQRLETMLPYIHGINYNSLVQTNAKKYGNFFDSKFGSQRTERQQNQVKTARCFGRGWTNHTSRNQKNLSNEDSRYGTYKFRDSFFRTPATNGGDMFSAQPGNLRRSYPFTRPSFFSPFNDDKVLDVPPNYSYN